MRRLALLVMLSLSAVVPKAIAGPLFSYPGPVARNGELGVFLPDDPAFYLDSFQITFNVTFTHLPGPGEFGEGLVTKYKGNLPDQSDWGVWASGNVSLPYWSLCGNGYTCIASNAGMVQTGVDYSVRALLLQDYGELWVDGSLVAAGPVSRNPWWSTSTPAVIGGSAGGDSFDPFYGTIRDIEISAGGPAVPEPGALLLVGTDLASLAGRRWRPRRG